MAISTLFKQIFRGAKAFLGVGIMSTRSQAAADIPTITSGSGAPSSAPPDGSLYMRTDASDGDDALYSRISGAWVALKGETA